MAILIDYLQIAISSAMSFRDVLHKGSDKVETKNLIRHLVLNSIRSYNKAYKSKYGKIIICSDYGKSWRKDFFPHYKARRKSDRQKSDLDWDSILTSINEIREELIENFCYKVIFVKGAEGDDIIAVLTKYFQDNEFLNGDLFDQPQPVLICSRDHDFFQLHKYQNVKQLDIKTKKFIKHDISPDLLLIEQIVKGDTKPSGDGIPNVKSSDDSLINGSRQETITAKYVESFLKSKDPYNNCEEKYKLNYLRNKKLIDFSEIPKDLENQILDVYKSYVIKGSRMKMINYLMKNKCNLLLNDIDNF